MHSAPDTPARIRPLRESDVESIIAIDARITGEAKPGFWRGLLVVYEPPPEGSEESAEGRPPASRPTYLCEVAEVEGRVVGFILGDVQAWHFGIPRCGRVIAIGVDPAWRRKGIASRLARELLEAFRKMNLPSVQCLVLPGDPLGDYFASLGFELSPWRTLEKRVS